MVEFSESECKESELNLERNLEELSEQKFGLGTNLEDEEPKDVDTSREKVLTLACSQENEGTVSCRG